MMDENKTTPESAAAQPESAPTPEQSAQPAAEQPATTQPTPEQPAAPQGSPAQPTASYDAQYAAQPVPTPEAQPVPAPAAPQPMPTAPVSPTPALVCGILAIVLCGIPILGIILGIVAIVMAGKYYKAGGTEGTAKGGKICGIIGIVLSAIMIILSCVLIAVGLSELADYPTTSTSISNTEERSTSNASADDLTEDEELIYSTVDPLMDQIKNQDPAMIATIANIMETSFNESLAEADLDVTLAGCGVDATELAMAMTEGFDYEGYYVSDDGDEAEANYEVTVRSIFDVCDVFYDTLMDAVSDISAGTMTQEEAYQLIGDSLMSAVQSSVPEENIWDVDLTKSGNTWNLDMESWNEELDYFFAFA